MAPNSDPKCTSPVMVTVLGPAADDGPGAVAHVQVGLGQGAALDRDLPGPGGSAALRPDVKGIVLGTKANPRRGAPPLRTTVPSRPAIRMAVPCEVGHDPGSTWDGGDRVRTRDSGTPGRTVELSTETGDTALT